MYIKKTKQSIIFTLFFLFSFSNIITIKAQEINLLGTVYDEQNLTIPYATVAIPKKNIGMATNDDGVFSIKVHKENLNDTLEVSTIGFKTYKVTVKEYIDKKINSIILIENVVALSTLTIKSPKEYVKKAFKKLKKNTLSSKHQLNLLYRRSSVENGKTRFLVENYLNIIDYGPSDTRIDKLGIAEIRKSADYRFVSKKQPTHAVNIMAQINPLRQRIYESDYKWKRIETSSYDGEDILIIRGRKVNEKKDNNWIEFYIGMDSYKIYQIKVSRYANEFSNLNAIYIYKKNSDGKLVLSYHNREANFLTPISLQKKKLLKLKTKMVKCSYRHEAIVLNIENNKKKFNVKNTIYKNKDIGEYETEYNSIFWKSINLPPKTKFYNKSVKELESIYGTPLETQFKAIN